MLNAPVALKEQILRGSSERSGGCRDFRYSRLHERLRDGADDLGFSIGGMTALQLAIRHLALVRRAVQS